MSPTTISGYKKIRRINVQELMNVPIRDLTKDKVQTAINDEAKKISPRTKKAIVSQNDSQCAWSDIVSIGYVLP